MGPRQLRQISHRLAGVIDDIKVARPPPKASQRPTRVVPRDPIPKESSTQPLRDLEVVRARYSADYSRFASIDCDNESDDVPDGNNAHNDLCEPFARRTTQALEECEARLAALASARSDNDDVGPLEDSSHLADRLDDMD